MNKKKAIKILGQQKEKIKNYSKLRNIQWNIETASYVKDFLGKESPEFKWISQFKWSVTYVSIDGETPKYVKTKIENKPKEAIQFLENCINIIENKGIYKEKKENWFSGLNNWKIVGILFAFIVFGFGIGYWTKEFEIFSIIHRKLNP